MSDDVVICWSLSLFEVALHGTKTIFQNKKRMLKCPLFNVIQIPSRYFLFSFAIFSHYYYTKWLGSEAFSLSFVILLKFQDEQNVFIFFMGKVKRIFLMGLVTIWKGWANKDCCRFMLVVIFIYTLKIKPWFLFLTEI